MAKHTSVVVILICLVAAPLMAEPMHGVIAAAAIREAVRLETLKAAALQTPAGQVKKSGGHPVLIGTALGAGVGAVAGYFTSSCSTPPPDDALACGTHYKGGDAVLGAVAGAGVGALTGLVFRHYH